MPLRPWPCAVMATWLVAVASAHAGGLAVLRTELTDNGDHDGYADTNETVEIRLTLQNTTGVALTGVTAHITSAPGRTICLIDGSAVVGDLAPGAVVTMAEPLIFHVCSDRDRTSLGLSAFAPFNAEFDLSFTANPFNPAADPDRLVFDLDLDVSGAGAPVSVTEDFEGTGFGLFQVQNLDLGRHDDVNPEGGLSNGWRCQYHEPYCDHASCQFDYCSLGATSSAADAIWWLVDGPSVPGGGRGFSGTHSLYFGMPLGPPLGYTTPLGVMEAVATSAPIHLSQSSPALTFKQQASFADSVIIANAPPGETADRGVVEVQLADAAGAPAGPWIKIDPSLNAHDQLPTSIFLNCSFDPKDDGSTGDDLFPGYTPADGSARRGPSSTCADERVFARMGSTAGAFDPLDTGNADGPGLAGASGPGTWVETRYDLSRFRGRSVRLRFLASTTRVGNYATWHDAGFDAVTPEGDDGWWIDDVKIEGASATPAVVSIDTHDNSGLAPDTDGDGIDDSCDNCPLVPNPSQADTDGDGKPDACDACPLDAANDADGDGVCGNVDNCPIPNPSQANADGDAFGDACDVCPFDAGNDADRDGLCGNVDNCSNVYNPAQGDADADGRGDRCDNCPLASNAGQVDADGDGAGDICDCQPNDPNDRQGPDVFLSLSQVQSGTNLSWPGYATADSFSVTRGDLASLGPGQYGSCLVEGRKQFNYLDSAVPAPGAGFFYLVQAQNWDCGMGPLGTAEQQLVNTDPAACVGVTITDSHPSSQTTIAGTVIGTLAGTQASDDQVESIREVFSSGGGPNRYSLLEHRFAFNVAPGLDRTLHVEGFRSSSADGDDFRIEYSIDNGFSFHPLSITLPLQDDDVDLTAVMGGNEVLSVIVRIVDTNHTPGTQSLDTVSIDEIWIRVAP